MGRGATFLPGEDEFLISHAEQKTAQEIYELHQKMRITMFWPERSHKSLARRIERLREEERLGKRTDEAKRKAYYGRDNFRSK